MKIIPTDTTSPSSLSRQQREWVYNGKDVCITAEVLDVLLPQLNETTSRTYAFSRKLQGPCLEMRIRGVRVDTGRRGVVLEECCELLDRLESQLVRIVGEGCGVWDFKWTSDKDLRTLFYETLAIPVIKKDGRPTCNRDALEKMESYFSAAQICKHLILMSELEKKIQMLRTEIDSDNRIRTSYNIAGTETGRLSSSYTEFGTGGNLQNIEEGLRSIFVSDPGYKLAYIDAEQGESRVVGAIEGLLFNDWRYLDACESGDLHTYVAKLVWPTIHWTGDLKRDRKLAEQVYYRHYDRRFMCKKLGHGSNYGGKPTTLATQTKVDLSLVKEFQPAYFKAFPAHQLWHNWTRRELHRTGQLVSIAGRQRWFWGKRDDDHTIREALAFQGQALADILNQGMINVWLHRDCQLLMQVHDAILVQYPEHSEQTVLPKILTQLRYPLNIAGREFIIPYSAATGWNWGKHSEKNPDGILSWSGEDKRKRSPQVSLLDRLICKVH